MQLQCIYYNVKQISSSIYTFKDTLMVFDNFKNKLKSVLSNVFWYVKIYIFWKCIQYTLHWDKAQMLKEFPSDKINGTKNVLFFLPWAPTNHSFNLQFLYELKRKICLSKAVCGIFHFRFRLVFIKAYIFVHQKAWTLWL